MSFSSELKKELSGVSDKPRHCRIALLAALAGFLGKAEGDRLVISSENPLPISLCAELIRKLFSEQIPAEEHQKGKKGKIFSVTLAGGGSSAAVLQALKLIGPDGALADPRTSDPTLLLGKRCCRCAYLRGAFLSAGTISDPDRFYHCEILCRSSGQAEVICRICADLGARAKQMERRGYPVVYVKDSEMISDLLGYMGARTGLLELENRRIIRGTRGNVNRRVNCETANINKTAKASALQIAAIRKIEKTRGLSSLPDGLDEIARLRLEYPAATLCELGQMLEVPIGKSGVNHRLRKIIELSNIF